jgi:mevalonate kinase
MIGGEHSVLYGYPGLVGAINQRIFVHLDPRSDHCIRVHSSLGFYEGSLKDLPYHPSFRFVRAVIQKFRSELPSGFDLTIRSEMDPTVGLGTSAAVCVGVAGLLQTWVTPQINWESPQSRKDLATLCLSVIRSVQGFASGGDVYASLWGGILQYEKDQFPISITSWFPPLTLVYSGLKIPTPEVVQWVQKQMEKHPSFYGDLYYRMSEIVLRMGEALRQKQLSTLGNLFQDHQRIQKKIGVSTPVIDQIVQKLNTLLQGAKISGSGQGDCIIAVGKIDPETPMNPGRLLPNVQWSQQGFATYFSVYSTHLT